MGKEWLYYFSGGSRSSGKRGGKTSKNQMKETTSTNTTSTTTSPSAGCINSLFNLFDFHHPFHFPNLHHNPPDSFLNFPLEEPLNIAPPQKGVEAPRNSLELIEQGCSFEQAATLSSNSSTIKKMNMKIKTSGSSGTYHDASSSECSSSSPAGTKTPTLVARLMGLDLVPENSSPRPSSSSSSNHYSSKSQVQNRPKTSRKSNAHDAMIRSTGCHSLPETPRVSSSRKSDAEQRYSLQINKENHNHESVGSGREFEFSKFLATKIAADSQEESNMSPGRYAKQIVKQFKESVNRRVGRDITNIYVTNNEVVNDYNEQRRDQHIVLLKSKKPGDHHESNVTPTSGSPRLRFLETKNKPSTTAPVSKNSQTCTHSPKVLPLSPLSSSPNNNQQHKCVTVTSSTSSKPKAPEGREARKEDAHQQKKCNVSVGSRDSYAASRLKKPAQTSDFIRNKKEESFVKPSSTNRAAQVLDKNKSKKTLLSNHVPTFLSVKKQVPPPLTTTLLQTQEREACATLSQLSRNLSTSYKSPQLTKVLKDDDINSNGTTTTTTTTDGEELTKYISAILKCTGIWKFTPLSSIKWYTYYSYPLDPSIYYHLQILFPKQNKLMFHLVDELLVHIMRPHFIWRCYEYWVKSEILNGPRLVKILCEKVRAYPSADCRVLEDIDALIDRDLGRKEGVMAALVEEEGDEIVAEIEGDILERLVHETVAMVIFFC